MTHTFTAELQPLDLAGPEPTPGSIVLAYGPTGTAYQRFHSDGLYHGTTGKVLTYDQLLMLDFDDRPLLVVYAAPPA